MMLKRDLCLPCAIKLGAVYSVKKVSGGVDNKIICAECGRRRYGATYEIGHDRRN